MNSPRGQSLQTRHRWNPVYPPGKPGKPHPVDCAVSGDAEKVPKAEKQIRSLVTRTQNKCHARKGKERTHALRAEPHICLTHHGMGQTDDRSIRKWFDLDRQHAGKPHRRTVVQNHWRRSPPSWPQICLQGSCPSARALGPQPRIVAGVAPAGRCHYQTAVVQTRG